MTEYLNSRQISEAFNIAHSTVYHLVRKGLLPQPIKKDGRWSLWKQEDIDALGQKYKPKENKSNKITDFDYELVFKENAPKDFIETLKKIVSDCVKKHFGFCPKCKSYFIKKRRDQVFCSERCRRANTSYMWRIRHLKGASK